MKRFMRFTFFVIFLGLIYWAVQFYDLRIKVPEPVEFQTAKEVVENMKNKIIRRIGLPHAEACFKTFVIREVVNG